MPSDVESSRRRHRRSTSDEEAEKSSKRHKHRHQRHHRHRSKKHGDDESAALREATPPPPVVPVVNSKRADDDDVEEGEILDEEGFKSVELSDQKVDSKNLGVCVDKSKNLYETDPLGDVGINLEKDSKTKYLDELSPRAEPKAVSNGGLDSEYRDKDTKWHRGSRSASRGSHNRSHDDTDMYESNEGKFDYVRKSSSCESDRDGNMKLTRSPSCDKYMDGFHSRRSGSHDVSRERSLSRSIVEDDTIMKGRPYYDRAEKITDDLRKIRHDRDLRRDLIRGKEQEFSASHKIYHGVEDSEYEWNGRVSEREMDRVLRREKERERSRGREADMERRTDREGERIRDKDYRKEKESESKREREMDRDQRRDKEWEKSWDRDMDRRREREQDRSREREVDKERRKEKERGRSRDRESKAESRAERQKGWSRDREDDLDRKRPRDRAKSSDRVKISERDRESERERDRDRYRDRERIRNLDRLTEWEQDRGRLNDKYRDRVRELHGDSERLSNANSDSLESIRDKFKRDEAEQDDFEERIEFKLAEQEEDLDRIKEESRKRRQAILEKYKNQKPQQHNSPQSENALKDKDFAAGPVKSSPTFGENPAKPVQTVNVTTAEGRNDHGDIFGTEPLVSVGKSPHQNGMQPSERALGGTGLGEGTPKGERSDEKYCDDIFGETPTGVRKQGKGDGLLIVSGLHDNWDDAEGYYSYRFGEMLDGQYEIAAAHGKGVFSTVVRAKDMKAGNGEPEEVAIKIIRNNETMHKAGQLEVQILQKLAGADPENRRHCVRYLSSFKYRNHLCLVFESLHMNLREVLKKFGRNIGLKLTAVRAYAKQLFIALKHLKNCGVLHCDIKPDNMLVNEAKNVLKLCDFGNAMFSGKNEVTPYLVSRFYRAPEVILGLAYDHPMDMWSVGCCLYELYTGKVLFPGPSNNDMLRLHMELKGPFPKKMLKKGAFVDQHFDHDLNFHASEDDPVTQKTIKRMILNIKQKDISSIIKGSPGEDPKTLAHFKDLLDKIFMLDPDKRITVSQALAHPFITVLSRG
ncbi:hypothetical protein K2173_017011 [Erythroxylum novogranatense]|uniref:Serine/threonine-protein kinase PRP4 homolog n=1 Tax=Erythroxylum novogranatense TaxID=1862640 RepID=A0AAV8U5K6_9ROSI|nr:hypothetical protein K2173_017011 [Erythroxylum novogranatense]